jgi:hypothetical protein
MLLRRLLVLPGGGILIVACDIHNRLKSFNVPAAGIKAAAASIDKLVA